MGREGEERERERMIEISAADCTIGCNCAPIWEITYNSVRTMWDPNQHTGVWEKEQTYHLQMQRWTMNNEHFILKEENIRHWDWWAASFYLDHCQHALISDGVGANGEVPRGVSADDAVDGVPVGAVRLIPVHHRQVGHHNVHLVLWHLPGKLQSGRKGREEDGWGDGREAAGEISHHDNVVPAVG